MFEDEEVERAKTDVMTDFKDPELNPLWKILKQEQKNLLLKNGQKTR